MTFFGSGYFSHLQYKAAIALLETTAQLHILVSRNCSWNTFHPAQMKAQPLWTCHSLCSSGNCCYALQLQDSERFTLKGSIFTCIRICSFFTIIVINMGTHCLDLAHKRLLSSCDLFLFMQKRMERENGSGHTHSGAQKFLVEEIRDTVITWTSCPLPRFRSFCKLVAI